jgi:hypothetical protein
MKILLIEPYVSKESLKSYVEKTEPVHLLGMYNLLCAEGIQVEIVDAYSEQMSASELVNKIYDKKATHVGLTTYAYAPCLSYLNYIVDQLRGNIITILGGPGPTYSPNRIAKAIKPDWIVKGDGEHALLDMVHSNFNPNVLNASRIDRTWVVDAPSVDLDEIPYLRPYSFENYNYVASPRLQRGCIGKCVFCLGAYQTKFSYLSHMRAVELFNYLVNTKKVKCVSPNGPDFTSVPHRANEIIRATLQADIPIHSFSLGVRLDTLSNAIKMDKDLWHELGTSKIVSFESSIESFCYSRLKRLGKNVSSEFFTNVFQIIEEIIVTCPCTIVLGRIALDPTITIDEFIMDNKSYIHLLSAFPQRVTIGGMLMNQFVPLWGTPSTVDVGSNNPFTRAGQLLDPAMVKLKNELLDHPTFRKWCNLAEHVSDFCERNDVFSEILRVATERAEDINQLHLTSVQIQ